MREGLAKEERREIKGVVCFGKRKDEIQEEVLQGQKKGQSLLSDP